MKIKEVEQIADPSKKISRFIDGTRNCILTREELMKCVEIPCLEATLLLYDKNIRTTSTDANKNTIGSNGHIRIDILSLSEENRKILRDLYPIEYDEAITNGNYLFNFLVPIHQESTVEEVQNKFLNLLPNFEMQDVLYGYRPLKEFEKFLLDSGVILFEEEISYDQQLKEIDDLLKKDGVFEQLIDNRILSGVEYIDASNGLFWSTKELYEKHIQYLEYQEIKIK